MSYRIEDIEKNIPCKELLLLYALREHNWAVVSVELEDSLNQLMQIYLKDILLT